MSNMQATAVVINAGLGDISLGLEMAGFKVIAAYEADEKALVVHRTNIDVPFTSFQLRRSVRNPFLKSIYWRLEYTFLLFLVPCATHIRIAIPLYINCVKSCPSTNRKPFFCRLTRLLSETSGSRRTWMKSVK